MDPERLSKKEHKNEHLLRQKFLCSKKISLISVQDVCDTVIFRYDKNQYFGKWLKQQNSQSKMMASIE